jgi:hypothetical protein
MADEEDLDTFLGLNTTLVACIDSSEWLCR